MTERARMVLASWLRSWRVWIALFAVAVDFGLQSLATADLLLLPLAQYAATVILVANSRGLLHGHVLLPGRSLVPGSRRYHLLLAACTVGLLLTPSVVASVVRAEVPTAQLSIPVGVLVGIAIASVRTPSVRGALVGACGGSLGPLVAWLEGAGPDSVVAGFFANPVQTTIIGAIAFAVAAGMMAIVLRRDESPNAFRGGGDVDAGGCGGEGENNWLASAMPLMRMRLLPRRPRATTPTWLEASAIWRRASDPLHRFGFGIVMAAFYALITFGDLLDEGALSVAASRTLHLFVVLGCGPIAIGYAGRRLRIESMRPLARGDMFRGFARAFTIDLMQFAAGLLMLTVVLHAVVDAPALADPGYWIHFLPIPGMLAVGAATTWIAVRWTHYGGFAGFVLASGLYVLIARGVDDDGGLLVAVLMTVVGFALAGVLGVVAQKAWKDFEPGRR